MIQSKPGLPSALLSLSRRLFARPNDVLDTSSNPLGDEQSNEQQTTPMEKDSNEKSDESDVDNVLTHPGNGNGHDKDPQASSTNGNGTASIDQATAVVDASANESDNVAKRTHDRPTRSVASQLVVFSFQLGPWLTVHRIRCSRSYPKRFFKSKSRIWAMLAGR